MLKEKLDRAFSMQLGKKHHDDQTKYQYLKFTCKLFFHVNY